MASNANALQVTDIDAVMKELYEDSDVEERTLKGRALLQWLKKEDDMGGDAIVQPVWHGGVMSVGHNLKILIANQENIKTQKFVLTESDFIATYGVVAITGKAMLASRNSAMSFIKAKDSQISSTLKAHGRLLHQELYQSGSGSHGQIATGGVSTTTVTLTRRADVYKFSEGQTVVANDTDDATSVKPDSAKVVSRNVDAKTVTFDVDVSAFGTAWAADDYLFTEGDPGGGMTGLAAWLPLAAPSSTAFFSVDRTKNMEVYAGHRVDKAGLTILESAEQLATKIGEFEGEPDALFLNPQAGNLLARQTGSKVERVNVEGKNAMLGFSGFKLMHFITGEIDIIFDWACPENLGYMLTRDDVCLKHMDALPHIVADDGKTSQRGSDSDTIQIRTRSFSQMLWKYLGGSGVMSVQVAS